MTIVYLRRETPVCSEGKIRCVRKGKLIVSACDIPKICHVSRYCVIERKALCLPSIVSYLAFFEFGCQENACWHVDPESPV